MDASVGDRIVVESEQAAQSGRAGVIEEVLAHDPPRFRIRWDDEHTSIFALLGRCREDRAEQEKARRRLTEARTTLASESSARPRLTDSGRFASEGLTGSRFMPTQRLLACPSRSLRLWASPRRASSALQRARSPHGNAWRRHFPR